MAHSESTVTGPVISAKGVFKSFGPAEVLRDFHLDVAEVRSWSSAGPADRARAHSFAA